MSTVGDRLAFHPGELSAQRSAGTGERAEQVRRAVVGATIPPEARDFLEWQRILVLGAADERGRVWATSLLGPEGFLSAPDVGALRVDADVWATDPLAGVLRAGTDVGTLVIDLVDRIRLRINGRWRPAGVGGVIDVHQAFGNCPKHLQVRAGATSWPTSALAATRSSSLDTRARGLVAAADTFFVATSAPSGADVSHRGGNPGFVSVVSPRELSWPDYVGNAMMMTAGNLAVDPRAGLLFPDWENGATLQLTGTAHVDFAPAGDTGPAVPGNGHRTVFRIEDVVWTEDGFPAGWAPPQYSRHNG